MVGALGQMTINSLENLSKPDTTSKEINKFSLIKMIETCIVNVSRISCVWDYIYFHLEYLATQKPTKALAIDALSSLIISILNYQKGNNNQFHKENWQMVVLTPLMDIILTNDLDSIFLVILNLRTIITNCGTYISKEGWQIVLGILEKVLAPSNLHVGTLSTSMNCIEEIYKCLEYICNNILFKLGISNVESLVVIIYHFITVKNNLNGALLAVSFLHNVMDYVSRQTSEELPEVQADKIWCYLFSKLKEIGKDDRGELRHVTYKTLDKIITTHGSKFSMNIWEYLLIEVAQTLLKFGRVNYFAHTKGNTYTNTLNKEESEEVIKIGGEIKEEDIKEWEDTIIIFYDTLTRYLTKFYSMKSCIPR